MTIELRASEFVTIVKTGEVTIERMLKKAYDADGNWAGAVHPAREAGWIAWWPGKGDQEALARFTRALHPRPVPEGIRLPARHARRSADAS